MIKNFLIFVLIVCICIFIPYCMITGQSFDVITQGSKISDMASASIKKYYEHYNAGDFVYISDNMMVSAKDKEKYRQEIYENLMNSYQKNGRFTDFRDKKHFINGYLNPKMMPLIINGMSSGQTIDTIAKNSINMDSNMYFISKFDENLYFISMYYTAIHENVPVKELAMLRYNKINNDIKFILPITNAF